MTVIPLKVIKQKTLTHNFNKQLQLFSYTKFIFGKHL